MKELKLKKQIDGTYSYSQLHNHDGISSLGDAFGRPDEIVAALVKRGIKNYASTNHGNMASIPQMYNCCKEAGINYIAGVEAYVISEGDTIDENGKVVRQPYRHLTLLAMNDKGFKNLIKLNNNAFRTNVFRGKARITYDDLFENSDNLIVMSACLGGVFSKSYLDFYDSTYQALDKKEKIRNKELYDVNKEVDILVKKFKYVFGDRLYIELMINHYNGQKIINSHLVNFINKYKIEPVFTNDVHYPEAKDHKNRDIIREFRYQSSSSSVSKENDEDNANKEAEHPDLYFRSVEEVMMTYRDVGYSDSVPMDIMKRAFQNTKKISDRCSFEIDTSLKLPKFSVKEHPLFKEAIRCNKLHLIGKEEIIATEALFQYLIIKGYEKELGKEWFTDMWKSIIKGNNNKNICEYMQRAYMEYKVIMDAGFIDYFLIVEGMKRFCEDDLGRLYGKGRGSVAGSVISWFLGITRDDPIKYNLLFERFMNAGRVKRELPDIDMDFPSDIRDKIKEYVGKEYGVDHVVNIGSIGTIKVKSAIQKVAAAHKYLIDGEQYDFHSIQSITHSIPQSIGAGVMVETIDDAVGLLKNDENNLFTKFYKKHKKWLKKNVEQFIMHPISYGEHAAGIVISPTPIDECIPIRIEDGESVSQWRDKDVLSLGFLKMDILGLTSLDQIEYAKRLISKKYNVKLPDMNKIDLEDKEVYKMIGEGDTEGVFQLSSNLFRAFFKELKPKKFEHIYSATALLRPGPLSVGAHKTYIELEHGEIEPEYLHPKMKKALERTKGLIIFQEQVLQICRDVAGFDLVTADEFRSIVGKKKKDKMPAMIEKFIAGSITNGIKEDVAKQIADMLVGWSSYGFNAAHAVSYSGISFYQAYIKKYFPREYIASKIQFGSTDVEKKESVFAYRSLLLSDGYKLAPIDVNTCSDKVKVDKRNLIHWKLDLIKTLGATGAKYIGKCKPYTSPVNLVKKVSDYHKKLKSKNKADGKISPINKGKILALISSGAFDFMIDGKKVKSRFSIGYEYICSVYSANKREKIIEVLKSGDLDKHKDELTRVELADITWLVNLHDPFGRIALQHKYLQFISEPYWRIFKVNYPEVPPGIVAASMKKLSVYTPVYVYGLLTAKNFKMILTKQKKKMCSGTINEYDGGIRFVIFPDDFINCTTNIKNISYKMRIEGHVLVWIYGSIIEDRYSGGKQIKVSKIGTVEDITNGTEEWQN